MSLMSLVVVWEAGFSSAMSADALLKVNLLLRILVHTCRDDYIF